MEMQETGMSMKPFVTVYSPLQLKLQHSVHCNLSDQQLFPVQMKK
jgi:hypothetical protein